MISSKERGKKHVEEQSHRGADDRGAETTGGGSQGGGRGAGSGGVEAYDLHLDSEVWRDGGKRGAGSEAVAGRECAAEEAGGRSEPRQRDAESGDCKKRMELVDQRADADWLRNKYAASQRRVCGLMGMAVASYCYRSRRSAEPLRRQLVELARLKPRFGYRRLQVLMQRSGERVNHKRLHRVYREAGLAIRRRKRKHCVREGKPLVARTSANQEWALDFVHDAVECGRTIRVLSVIDAVTRECLALEVDTSFASRRVTRVLDAIIAERGRPTAIRVDSGPEFTSRHFVAWCVERGIELIHIQPGKPTQNARVESFHGRFREECLRVSWFQNLFEARRQIAAWRKEYNEERPHSSLGYLTPHEYAVEKSNSELWKRRWPKSGQLGKREKPRFPLNGMVRRLIC